MEKPSKNKSIAGIKAGKTRHLSAILFITHGTLVAQTGVLLHYQNQRICDPLTLSHLAIDIHTL